MNEKKLENDRPTFIEVDLRMPCRVLQPKSPCISGMTSVAMFLTAKYGIGEDPRLLAGSMYLFPNEETVSRSLRTWMARLDRHDPALLAHALQVERWTKQFGGQLGMNRERLQRLRVAAILHDVGKLTISAAVLSKPGELEPEELALVQNHATAGYEMLSEEGVHLSDEVLNVVRFHHERLDGSGYPQGLRGDQINQDVRIIMICDIYSALRENRPYNRPMNCRAALRRMLEETSRIDMELFKVFAELAFSDGGEHGCLDSNPIKERCIFTLL